MIMNRDVYWFLKKNPFLVPLVEEAAREIKKRISEEDVWVVCELFTDPESDEELLFLLIRSNLSSAQGDALEHRLYEEWWLDQMPRANGKMVISVE